jgi:transposase
MTSWILAFCDALGKLLCFVLLRFVLVRVVLVRLVLVRFVPVRGYRFDTVGLPPSIEGIDVDAPVAAMAFDGNAIIAELARRDAAAMIARHPGRAVAHERDAKLPRRRHPVEIGFRTLKEFKRIAIRRDKTGRSFPAMLCRATAVIHSR